MDADDAELDALRAKRARELLEAVEQQTRWPQEPVDIDDGDVQAFVRQHAAAVIDLWAPWCAPCRAIAPTLARLARQYNGRVAIGKINVDDHPHVLATYGVQSIPTLLLFKGGATTGRIVGAQPANAISAALDQLVA